MDFMGSYAYDSNCSCNMANSKMKTKYDFIDISQIILMTILIVFGLFILYQIIRKIMGGSWATEDIIVTLLLTLIGIVFTTSVQLAKLRSDHNNLSHQFKCLAKDFKEHNY